MGITSLSLQTNLNITEALVHDPITRIKLEIPIYFTDHSEFITDQFRKILSKAIENEILSVLILAV